ncbi:hypothetical protein N7451_011874 [Penicillium sp. IBT 35674x]|nr:hypothetical protein N7451_011874 [Penicillium sp. IBT 35674x]
MRLESVRGQSNRRYRQKKLSHDAYRVGWICPLEVEQIAAMEMLDEEHQPLPQSNGDTNIYNLGSINGHSVVIAGLPRAGNNPAATVVTQMRMTFPNLKYGLLVGTGLRWHCACICQAKRRKLRGDIMASFQRWNSIKTKLCSLN